MATVEQDYGSPNNWTHLGRIVIPNAQPDRYTPFQTDVPVAIPPTYLSQQPGGIISRVFDDGWTENRKLQVALTKLEADFQVLADSLVDQAEELRVARDTLAEISNRNHTLFNWLRKLGLIAETTTGPAAEVYEGVIIGLLGRLPAATSTTTTDRMSRWLPAIAAARAEWERNPTLRNATGGEWPLIEEWRPHANGILADGYGTRDATLVAPVRLTRTEIAVFHPDGISSWEWPMPPFRPALDGLDAQAAPERAPPSRGLLAPPMDARAAARMSG